MRILVTGAHGQLGMDILEVFKNEHDVVGYSKDEWDVTNQEKSLQIICKHSPNVVIHCAAYTNVDSSEKHFQLAYKVNVDSTRNIASLCQEKGIRFVYISTDYVFNGEKKDGYTEEDSPHPINTYGRLKRLGEKWTIRCCSNHLIIRTSWLYGIHGRNFVYSILKKAKEEGSLSVVGDQVGSPTYTFQLVEKIKELIHKDAKGLFHVSHSGRCSWYEFSQAILGVANLQVPIKQVASDELCRLAKRPAYSVLHSTRLLRLGIGPLPDWREGLKDFMKKGELIND